MCYMYIIYRPTVKLLGYSSMGTQKGENSYDFTYKSLTSYFCSVRQIILILNSLQSQWT